MAAAKEASSFAKVYSAVNKKEWFYDAANSQRILNPSSNDINFPPLYSSRPFSAIRIPPK